MSDPIIETPPPIEVEVITGAATPLSTDTPEDLGTAAAGVSTDASRSDHVHAMPSAADVGADPAGAANAVAGDLSTHESLTTSAHGGIVGDADARLTDARTPLAHAVSHQDGGTDELALDGSQITTGTVDPARLGSGTASADTVLHGDGAWRRGHVDAVANASTFPGHAPVGPNHAPTAASPSYHGMSAVGREGYVPFFCPAGTYDSIGVNVTAAAASTWRIGVADMASTGWPGEILLDAGTLDMSIATGWRVLAIGFVVDRPRWMWMQVKCTAFTAAPTVTCLDGVSSAASSPRLPGWPLNGNLPARAFVGCYTNLSRGSGSLHPAAPMTNGDTSTGLGLSQTSPLIVMRRSA